MAILYRRDVPTDDRAAFAATSDHIRAHLSAIADPDDDPRRFARQVQISVTAHSGDPSMISVTGELDATPRATYLADDYDPELDHPEIIFERYEERM
jgi:hypothetical protein